MADNEWGTGMSGAPLASVRSASVVAAARLTVAKYRRTEQRFLIDGPQGVRAALAADTPIERLFVTLPASESHSDLVDTATARRIPVTICEDAAVARLSSATTPAGVVAVCAIPQISLSAEVRRAKFVVALWRASDPGNVGTVIRTADAMGADLVVLTADSVDPYNDKCVRSTAGSISHVPVVTGVSVEDLIADARTAGLTVVAAAMDGLALTDPSVERLLAGPVMWIFGSEAHGLPDSVCAAADAVVAVPMVGRAESLNLGVAAGVCMYATAVARTSAGT